MAINDISRINAYADAVRVSGQGAVHQTPTTQKYNSNQTGQALVSTSNAYRQHQTELTDMLKSFGFDADKAFKLAQIGHLNLKNLTRSLLIAQMLTREPALFDEFAKTLKNITSRGQNLEEGVRAFLDKLDRILGQDTRTLAEAALKGKNYEVESVLNKNYSQNQHGQTGERNFSENLARDLGPKFFESHRNAPLNPRQFAEFDAFLQFFKSSMDEFPGRYHVDAYAQNELGAKGLSLENYLKLASEVPPLRLVNLLALAEKQGVSPQEICKTLLDAQLRGEDLGEVMTRLENQHNAATLGKFSNPLFSLDAGPQTVPLSAMPLTLTEGQKLALSFYALDAFDGLLHADKCGFVIYPQKSEHPGQTLDLSHLPVGVYYVLLAGLNSKNKILNFWMKVIVEKKRRDDEGEEKTPDQKNGESETEKNDGGGGKDQGALPDFATSAPALQKDFVSADFGAGKLSLLGPFLGEIVMPLDYMNRDPSELVILSPGSGIVVSPEEFASGVFTHNAVVFRFLANHIEATDLKKRHQLLSLKMSPEFAQFEKALKEFNLDPRAKIGAFHSELATFFDRLTALFPQGRESFKVARGVFEREADAFAGGVAGGAEFKVESSEGDAKKFLAAAYAKGGYALAAGGDVPGALNGLAKATLCDLSDTSHKAALGEYLENLKNVHYAKAQASDVQAQYDTHLFHRYGETIQASPYFSEMGEKFVKAVALALPAAELAPAQMQALNPYLKPSL